MDSTCSFYDQQSSTINYSQPVSARPNQNAPTRDFYYEIQQQKNLICFLKFYHFSSNDDNFYLVNCKIISQEDTLDSHDRHSHEFFYQHPSDPSTRYHVTCKLLSSSLVENVLNDEICEMDFDMRVLSIHQKLHLEQSLKQKLYYRVYCRNTYSLDIGNHVIVTPIADIQNYSYNDLPGSDHFINGSESTYIQPQQQVDFNNFTNYQNHQNSFNPSLI
ncbi:hypothetical protein RhiirA5_371114 [Rhizophagus irregularis]|uniref:Uncharacterized protein n=1 Tax=Rhizophagus irregularis TaxID=588596 RepID=A0A2I1DWC0_9GLOM|nr:hypothetical protein RhiirA5_371114 [Rhizophagus irregularis]PKC70945.1 hypothetical protein RhiirA1_390935 [Rhizophagus irregularis]PKY14171.1 hypothetical protein RhiirB3_379872 [Rhizophagus irregularis]CAB4473263.1 unnamed protein product [Rhizophagus irregularis]CAB5153698.1 unnamed protein product [Rhizophagus irregularis]